MKMHRVMTCMGGCSALAACLLLAACAVQRAPSYEVRRITDPAFLMGSLWNDGQAEVAFYEVVRSRDPYGQPAEQTFLVGTYLVKHDFDPVAQAKAADEARQRTSAFKYALFYEFESDSYQYKRSYVTNAAQADLTPLKTSLASFDWCSNLYRELAFEPEGAVQMRMRSDDYGNDEGRFDYRPNAYPAALLPLLVRGLDFSQAAEQAFSVVLPEGRFVEATARKAGVEPVETPAGVQQAEKIVVRYAGEVPSLIGEQAEAEEVYWRGTGPERLLLQMEAQGGRYRMHLVEHLRSPYWRENLWPRLTRVTERP